VDALPGWQRDFVLAEATATQTPPDLAATLVLAVNAAACAKKAKVVVNPDYAEPLNLFLVPVLPSGNRKSAVFCDVTRPLSEFEEAEAKRVGPEIAEAAARRAIDEARLARLQADAAKAKTPQELESLTLQAVELSRSLAETKVPVAPRLLASDTTAEKLSNLLLSQGGKMAVMSPEGDLFDSLAGRYGGGGSPNFGVYLNGHAGDDLRVDRIGRPPEFVKEPALTIGVAVQPDVIRCLADKPGFRGRGLIARFLFAMPESLVGRRDPDPPPVPAAVRAEYDLRVRALLELPGGAGGDGRPVPHALRLGPEAARLRRQFGERLEPKLHQAGDLGHVADWGSKLPGAVVRIAVNRHMAEHVGVSAPWGEPISGETMGRAIRVGEYLIEHAHAAFVEMGADPTVGEARSLLAWVDRHGKDTFTRRDLFEGTKGRFKRVDALQPGLDLLVTHGFLRVKPAPARTGPGRKPSPVYEVNPLTRSRKSHESQNPAPPPPHTHPPADSANPAESARPVPPDDGSRTRDPVSAEAATPAAGETDRPAAHDDEAFLVGVEVEVEGIAGAVPDDGFEEGEV
jgi:hypothetical protein